MEVHPPAVAADRAVDPLVADGDVEIAVHREPEIGGDVVVPVAVPRGSGWCDSMRIDFVPRRRRRRRSKTLNFGVVQDEQLAVDVLHAEDGVEPVGERRDAAVGVEAEDAALLQVGPRRADVHRVLGDEDPPVRGAADDRRVAESRRPEHHVQPPTVRGMRQPGVPAGGRARQQREQCRREELGRGISW